MRIGDVVRVNESSVKYCDIKINLGVCLFASREQDEMGPFYYLTTVKDDDRKISSNFLLPANQWGRHLLVVD